MDRGGGILRQRIGCLNRDDEILINDNNNKYKYMSTVLGLIFNDEVIMASNTPMANDERGDACITTVFVYNVEPQVFHVSLTGTYQEIQQFHLKLLAKKIVGAHVSADVFADTCYTILKQLFLSDLRIIAVCFAGGPSLHLISVRGIEQQMGPNSYLIALPASFSAAEYYLANRRFTGSEFFQTKAAAFAFIQNVFGQLPDPGVRLPGATGYDYVSILNPFDSESISNRP